MIANREILNDFVWEFNWWPFHWCFNDLKIFIPGHKLFLKGICWINVGIWTRKFSKIKSRKESVYFTKSFVRAKLKVSIINAIGNVLGRNTVHNIEDMDPGLENNIQITKVLRSYSRIIKALLLSINSFRRFFK
jgi:hypothetical protein